ncbi:MAG TPA: LCP family protein, partial [Candidatus Dormibacteraeota bacterium]|nr:LCP family protein [Candidatus Dormibacteraeota bacterium]
FPGLGHAYAGAYQRALGFAAAPIFLVALLAGIVLRASQADLLGLLLAPWLLPSVFVINIIALLYRVAAIVDAYRVAAFLNAAAVSGGGRLGRPRVRLEPLSVAGLVAVILVMSGAHVVVARYDLEAQDLLTSNCIFIDNTNTADTSQCDTLPSPSAASGPTDAPVDTSSPEPSDSGPAPQGSDLPAASIPPWNGTERLNILLIGSDQRPQEGTFNTDTLIVASIDPTTRQVAMFSLPRDSTNIPLPPGPLRNAYASYGGVYPKKINSLFTTVRNRADLVSGTSRTRGFNGLKLVLGNLYGLDIKYFVEVNFEGFRQVVDALGGVTINVQVPVVDNLYPSDSGRTARVYIPAGIQHMTGAQALVYARSRHGSDDFDRGARQQRVITSMREQADVATIIPRIPQLIDALKATVKTDIPQSELAKLAGLASTVDTKDIRSYVFSYPRYGTQTPPGVSPYAYLPNAARIRAAVASAFKVDPKLEDTRNALSQENASIWVLNGSHRDGEGSDVAAYLEYYGLTASAPQQAPVTVPADTRVVVYNGAETNLTATIAFLESTFKTKVVLVNDPAARADIVITTTRSTPILVPPATP